MSLAQRDLGPRSPWGAFLRRMAVVDEQLMALIARRRAEGAGGDDVLAQLLAAGLDDAELRDHLVTLLAAGHETTAGSLAWALERLARAPEVFARVRAGDEAWIDAVVKETLRIRPVLTVAPRKLAAPLRVDGLELPAGVHVAPCIYLVHRREDLYPDARTWRPRALARGGARARGRPSRGSRSAAACAAAWARPSRRWRWPRSCASSPSASTSRPRTPAASACAGAASRCSPAAARASCSAMLLRLLRLDRLGRRQRLAVARLVDGDEREALGAVGQLGGDDLVARRGERRDARLDRAVLRAGDRLVAALALAAAAVASSAPTTARS